MKPEHELFCYQYIGLNFNGVQAYLSVYPNSSYEAARRSASDLLSKPDVRRLIAQLIEDRIRQAGLEVNDVLIPLVHTATADPNELIEVRRDCCRYCWGIGNLYQYTRGEWAAIVEQYDNDKDYAERDGQKPPREPAQRGGVGFDKRMPPNEDCPECFGEGVEDIIIKDTRNLSPAGRALYAGVKVTRDGFDVKMHSRDKAIELLGRHLAMFTDNVDHKNNGQSFEPMTLAQFYGKEE